MNIYDYGFSADMMPENMAGIPARITAVHRERYAVVCENGEVYARLKAKEYYAGDEQFPTVGDFVLLKYVPDGDSQIIATLPRKTFFSRRDPDKGKGEQAVAANFDYVFIMQSLNMDFNITRLERYLTLVRQSGAQPVIVLTKADLVQDTAGFVNDARSVALGADICVISSKDGTGIDALMRYMQPRRTVVFLGSSGVGKSSLVNAIAGEEVMSTGAIREDDSKGRHTTTHRQLIMLESGVMIIDTPGMRELGMWKAADGLNETFQDIEELASECRFRDCTHSSEPGCAIRAAIEAGELSAKRWKSYCTLKKESKYSDERESYAKQKQQWGKNIQKHKKNSKKNIW